MRRNIALLLTLLLLCSCGEVEEVEYIEQSYTPLRNISYHTIWEDLDFTAITPVCAFDTTETALLIFPYNDNVRYIKVRMFLSSNNALFDDLVQTSTEENIIITDNYTLVTLSSGMNYALVDDTYLISTDLPSSYCEKVAVMLCLQLGL